MSLQALSSLNDIAVSGFSTVLGAQSHGTASENSLRRVLGFLPNLAISSRIWFQSSPPKRVLSPSLRKPTLYIGHMIQPGKNICQQRISYDIYMSGRPNKG